MHTPHLYYVQVQVRGTSTYEVVPMYLVLCVLHYVPMYMYEVLCTQRMCVLVHMYIVLRTSVHLYIEHEYILPQISMYPFRGVTGHRTNKSHKHSGTSLMQFNDVLRNHAAWPGCGNSFYKKSGHPEGAIFSRGRSVEAPFTVLPFRMPRYLFMEATVTTLLPPGITTSGFFVDSLGEGQWRKCLSI